MKKIIGLLLVLFLTLTCLQKSATFAKANPNHNLRQKTFVHYPEPERGRKPPRPPAEPTCAIDGSDQVKHYLLGGWQMPEEGLTYRINYTSAPTGIQKEIGAVINQAFSTWTATDSAQIFIDGGPTGARNNRYDGINAIAWKGVDSSAIAITYIWYWEDTMEVAEVDTMFNKNLPWTVSPYTKDCINSPTYDVQNIATHEFGHWIGLDDLYNGIDSELTMYGYGATGELKKDTLGAGDTLGALKVAP